MTPEQEAKIDAILIKLRQMQSEDRIKRIEQTSLNLETK